MFYKPLKCDLRPGHTIGRPFILICAAAALFLLSAGYAWAVNYIVDQSFTIQDGHTPFPNDYIFIADNSGIATSSIIAAGVATASYPNFHLLISGIHDDTAGVDIATSTQDYGPMNNWYSDCVAYSDPSACKIQINFDTSATFIAGHQYSFRATHCSGGNIECDRLVVLKTYTPTDKYWIQVPQGVPPDSIEITFPPNSSSTPDFGNFILDWYANAPTSTYVGISYGPTSTLWAYYDQSGAGSDNEYLNVVFPKTYLLSQGNYYAQANLFQYDENYDKIYTATSSLINFNIGPGTYISFWYPTPSSTASSTEMTLTCDQNSNLFSKSICYVLEFLFVPDFATLSKFDTLADELKNKAPIGYFYSFSQAIGGLSASTTPAFVLEGTSSLDNVFGPLKTGVSFLLYFSFTFWVFHRLRHFDLT